MPTLELIELYPSPWSERVRWVLELKGSSYRRTPFVPLASEEEHARKTGIRTAPVLIADGEVVGDSDRSVDWLEARHPTPVLVPGDPRRRAEVRAWELFATEVLAPAARLVMIGRYQAMNLQPLADYFAAKYHWTAAEEARVDRLLRTALPELAAAVAVAPHLVGDGFTRADLTVAALLAPALGLPPDDLFSVVNGDAETTGTALDPVPGWTAPASSPGTPIATVVPYGAPGGFPDVSSPGPSDRGSNFFGGGQPGGSTSGLQQTIDLTGATTTASIDAGTLPFTLCGFLGGFSVQDDNVVVTAQFRDGSAANVGSVATIGPVLAVDRNDVTGLCLRTTSGTVPVGARQVVVTATMTGSFYLDGYADNLTLVLASSCPQVAGTPCFGDTTTTTSSTTSTSSSSSSTPPTSSSTSSSTSTSSSSSSLLPPTTSTPTTATTTTLASGCGSRATTFASIDCRLQALRDDVTGATDLGSLQGALEGQVAGAASRFERVPSATNARQARAFAKGSARKLLAFSHRVSSNHGRKVILSAATRSRLTTAADAIRSDMITFRKTL